MPVRKQYDAVVVGSGPNGLAAAIVLAEAGRSVLVIEGKETVGGGLRSAELTLPGFVHDNCATIHALGLGSPFLRRLPLHEYGLEWVQPGAPLAHPLDDGSAVLLHQSVEETAVGLGSDGPAYRRLMEPLVDEWQAIVDQFLGPLRVPRHPLTMARFGLSAIRSAVGLARGSFKREPTRALFAGLAAHSILPLDQLGTAGFGLVLGLMAHAVGWPLARGGSQAVADALTCHLEALGGEIATGKWVRSLADVPASRAILFDVTPRQLVDIAGEDLPATFRRRLKRFRYGPGVFKVDWALDGPIPWRNEGCLRAGTVHVGGTLTEMAQSEKSVWEGRHPERPYVLLVQASLFDETRAPTGGHTVWAYCHVPNGSTQDMAGPIIQQIERFAPGFRDRIVATHTYNASEMEAYSPNYVGGDINGGAADLRQLFTRPIVQLNPYTTPNERIYLCSSSTPPGGGVHGMSGYYAAQAALRRVLT
ncbi:MAG: NAD(P)/FAD-dependent oxidoreductase [Candidatus Promineifilaceae bacterium]|nr:NAD(P)/FAD-dependent oxidoreductase [Candidatus Promineifilaceae bacterium]